MCALLIFITFLGGKQGRGPGKGLRLWKIERPVHLADQSQETLYFFFDPYSVNSRPLSKSPWVIRKEGRAPIFLWSYHVTSLEHFEIQKYSESKLLFLHSTRRLRMKILLPNILKSNELCHFFSYTGIWINHLID